MSYKLMNKEALPNSARLRTIPGAFIAVTALSFLLFIPDLRNGFLFTWDDGVYITYNDHIRELSAETIRWAFFEYYASYWAPLTWISLAIDRTLWGLEPVGYHLTNNLLHAGNAGMYFLLSLSLLRSHISIRQQTAKESALLTLNRNITCSLLAALIFAVHPLRVESVAWATERKDVLSLFFGIPAVLLYLKHVQNTMHRQSSLPPAVSFLSSGYYWLSLLFYCLSLLSKSTLVTLPLVLLVLDWFPLKRFARSGIIGVILEKAPLALFAGGAAILTMQAQSSDLMPFELSGLLSRIQIAFKAVMTYLLMTTWPVNLSPFYLHPGNIIGLHLEYVLPIILFLTVSACCVLLVKQQPVLLAAWLIYLITLLPVLGFAQGGFTAMSDRYTYVPGMAISLVAALGIIALMSRLSASRIAVLIIAAGTVFLLLAACYLTVQQISYWKDDVVLWTRAIDVKPHFSGRVYFQRGRSYVMKGDYQRALEDMNEALDIATQKKHREIYTIFAERARILRQMGNLNGAIEDYSSALASDNSPRRSMYYRERGNVYREMGNADLANEDFRMADGGN